MDIVRIPDFYSAGAKAEVVTSDFAFQSIHPNPKVSVESIWARTLSLE
jgi:hypothetical protein